MKSSMYMTIMMLLVLMGCGADNAGGTVVDVNSGSIAGELHYDSRRYKEVVEVRLVNEENDSLIEVDTTEDGSYRFDSLAAGSYKVQPTIKGGFVKLAHAEVFILDSGDALTEDFAIRPILKRKFEVVPKDSSLFEIRDFQLSFGVVEKDTVDPDLFVLYFSTLEPRSSFGVSYLLGNDVVSHKMNLDIFNMPTYELTTLSDDFGVINSELVTKTGENSTETRVKLYFYGSGNAYQHLQKVGDLILTTQTVDTVALALSVSQTALSFEYSSSFPIGEMVQFDIELRDTLSNALQFSGSTSLTVPENATVDLPIVVMPVE